MVFFKNNNIVIDKAYCLFNPEKRGQDFINKLVTSVRLNGISSEIDFFIVGKDYKDDPKLRNDENVFQCHKRMVMKCLEEKLENVLFLEDDVVFTNDFKQILDTIKFPDYWDSICLGGYTQRDPVSIKPFADYPNVWPDFFKVRSTYGLFGALLNNRTMQNIMKLQIPFSMDNGAELSCRPAHLYILIPPIIVERHVPSAVNNLPTKRNIWHQCIRLNRIFPGLIQN